MPGIRMHICWAKGEGQHSEFSFCVWLVSRWQCSSALPALTSFVEKNKNAFIFSWRRFFDVNNVESTPRTIRVWMVWIKFINQSNPEMSDVFRMWGDAGYLLLHDHSRIHSHRKNTPRQKKTLDVFHSKYYWMKTWRDRSKNLLNSLHWARIIFLTIQ